MSASTASPAFNVPGSPRDQAIRTLCSGYFHRALWLPETSDHPKLRVTYSTTTNFDNASLPVILFIGPMFGCRWNALDFDKLTRDCGVRLICTDRPAFGGSTPVAISIRMKVWLETVPALLQKLDIKHASLVTHSAGTIYTLNTIFHHRDILDPKAPTVVFLAPYVPTSASGATLTTLLSKLPSGMLNSWSDINAFVNTKVFPSAAWSSGTFSSATSLFTTSSATTDLPGTATPSPTTSAKRYGVDEATAKELEKLYPKFRFAEEHSGANDEAKLCLRKCEDDDWGAAQDYASCIETIVQNELTAQQEQPGRAKLVVEVFFAGSDIMSGKRGQEYFEECWQREGFEEEVEFKTRTYERADHDGVLVDYEKGALRDAFERVAGAGREGIGETGG